MKKINLRDYYPYYTQDMIVEVPDEVALLLREYTSSHPNCNINLSAMPLACSLTTEYTLLQVLHSVFRAADGAAR